MSFRLFVPFSVSEAIRLQKETGGQYLAGGTVTLVNDHHGKKIGEAQIALERIPELKEITFGDGFLVIGSMVTMDSLEQSPLVKKYAFALWQAASEVGGPQIRNRATLGGNLAAASPSSDCAPPLLALDAKLLVSGAEGEREIPLREFFEGYLRHALREDELILSVRIPVREDAVSRFRKVGKRNALSVSAVNMALVRTGKEFSISVGACAPVPVYCAETSELLSRTGDLSAARETILTEICPIDDRWATASYRRTVCGNLLRALFEETEEKP